ncbi:uncharacterized protein LOC108825086 [Raphanus sativus]|uniref:Uncharacterized protein LOC108825086 n=1 Tax=Raphanus sativus TaxID=3726 RepID=A0A6J0L192_RAPSA|nr:uncharacterized protein LOC108825086 [Raphanus sativus]
MPWRMWLVGTALALHFKGTIWIFMLCSEAMLAIQCWSLLTSSLKKLEFPPWLTVHWRTMSMILLRNPSSMSLQKLLPLPQLLLVPSCLRCLTAVVAWWISSNVITRLSKTRFRLALRDMTFPFNLMISTDHWWNTLDPVEYVKVPRHPLTNAINHRCTVVTLRGEGAAEKALALNGTNVGGLGGWRVTVKLLPPTMKELLSGKSPRQLAL